MNEAIASFAAGVAVDDSNQVFKERLSAFDRAFPEASINRVSENDRIDIVFVEAPMQFGATNWIAVVALDERRVRGVGVRTADSVRLKPSRGPADRVAAETQDFWRGRYGE